jgi:FMN reductase
MPFTLVGLGGSMRAGSQAAAALHEALAYARTHGADAELLDLNDLSLPVFLPDVAPDGYEPAARRGIERLLTVSRRADAFLWASPTYHGTMSGAFKNALDFFEHLAQDDPPYLQGRAVGLMALHDADTLAAMASCVREFRAWLAPTRVLLSGADFGADGRPTSERSLRRIRRLVDELLAFPGFRG